MALGVGVKGCLCYFSIAVTDHCDQGNLLKKEKGLVLKLMVAEGQSLCPSGQEAWQLEGRHGAEAPAEHFHLKQQLRAYSWSTNEGQRERTNGNGVDC